MFRKRLNYPELKHAVRENARHHRADVVLIENRAAGIQLIQELTREGLRGVAKYEPEGDKFTRMFTQAGFIESGAVHLPREASWLDDYLNELVSFPKSIYCDQVDSTSQALDWQQRNRRNGSRGLLEYQQRELERMRGTGLGSNAKPAPITFVRMRAPRQGQYIMNNKYVTNDPYSRRPSYHTGADGIIEHVHPEDAKVLQRQGCVIIDEDS